MMSGVENQKRRLIMVGTPPDQTIVNCAISFGYDVLVVDSPNSLRSHICSTEFQTILYICTQSINDSQIERYLKLKSYDPNIKFIIQAIRQIHITKYLNHHDIWFVRSKDLSRSRYYFKNLLNSEQNYYRTFDRLGVTSPAYITDSTDRTFQGEFVNFTGQGASLQLSNTHLREKEFVSIRYQDINKIWVKMYSQVRWQKSLDSGKQQVGVKFLAYA